MRGPPSPDELALLDAIAATPDDDGPRLVLADLLLERGDPRGELIVAQCFEDRALVRAAPESAALDEHARSLFEQHGREWVRDLDLAGARCVFRRGFVEQVEMDLASFLGSGEAFFRLRPVPALRLWRAGDPRLLARLAELRELSRVRVLDLEASDAFKQCDGDVLFGSPAVSGLERLRVRLTGASVATARAMARSPHLARLAWLDIGWNAIGDEGVDALAGAAWFRGLRFLDVGATGLGPAAMAALARAPTPVLERMVLSDEMGVAGVRALFAPGAFPALRRLVLADARLGDDGAACVARSPALGQLRVLSLRGNGIGARGAAALADAPPLGTVEVLDLGRNEIGDQGVAALATSPHVGRLVHLDVSHNGVGEAHGSGVERLRRRLARSTSRDGVAALVTSAKLDRLVSLDLSGNAIGPAGARRLASGDGLPSLAVLDLRHNPLGARGAAALAASAWLRRLASLVVSRHGLGPSAEQALRRAFGRAVRFRHA